MYPKERMTSSKNVRRKRKRFLLWILSMVWSVLWQLLGSKTTFRLKLKFFNSANFFLSYRSHHVKVCKKYSIQAYFFGQHTLFSEIYEHSRCTHFVNTMHCQINCQVLDIKLLNHALLITPEYLTQKTHLILWAPFDENVIEPLWMHIHNHNISTLLLSSSFLERPSVRKSVRMWPGRKPAIIKLLIHVSSIDTPKERASSK